MKLISNTLLIILLSTQISYAQKPVEIAPSIKKQPVLIQFIEKELSYYPIDTKDALYFSVKDLDKVVIYSRKSIQANNSSYTIKYKLDNKDMKSYKSTKVFTDRRSSYKDKSIQKKVSKLLKKTIPITEGVSVLSLVSEKSTNIAVNIIGYKDSKKIKLKPQNSNIKPLSILWGASFKYYKLNSEKLTKIELNDYGKLIVYTRMRMSEDKKTQYSFSYRIDDLKRKKLTIDGVDLSKKATYKSIQIPETPSTYQKTTIDIKKDYQSILFSSDDQIDARFVFVKKVADKGWNEVVTSNRTQIPLLVKKDNQVRFYNKITTTKTFDFKIDTNKPTKLKVYIRGEFTYEMLDNNDYEIVLTDNGKILNTYKLSCHRSKVMKYKSNDDLIPGTLDKLIIDVPDGKHNYSIRVNNRGKTALVRVLHGVGKE